MKQLDPKYIWFYFISSSMRLVLFIFFFSIFFLPTFLRIQGSQTPGQEYVLRMMNLLLVTWIVISVVTLGINYFWALLTYKFYRYEVREDGFRIERGVIWKRYVTIPYERIQNVDIYRGLLARILKLSDIHIQTAGMSAGAGFFGQSVGSEGRLPGLSPADAEQLRDELIKRAKGKHQGL